MAKPSWCKRFQGQRMRPAAEATKPTQVTAYAAVWGGEEA